MPETVSQKYIVSPIYQPSSKPLIEVRIICQKTMCTIINEQKKLTEEEETRKEKKIVFFCKTTYVEPRSKTR